MKPLQPFIMTEPKQNGPGYWTFKVLTDDPVVLDFVRQQTYLNAGLWLGGLDCWIDKRYDYEEVWLTTYYQLEEYFAAKLDPEVWGEWAETD
jgi:hypothetical protein